MPSTELLALKQRRFPPTADRRMPRVCYLDDRPAFLEVGSALYAVHDIGGGGLRLSQFAAPAVPSPEATAALPALGKTVGGLFRLRSGGSVRLEAVAARVDAGGVLRYRCQLVRERGSAMTSSPEKRPGFNGKSESGGSQFRLPSCWRRRGVIRNRSRRPMHFPRRVLYLRSIR